jgi:hypothetical protein
MTKLPKPAIETTAFSRDSSTQPYYTEAQMTQFRRDALEEAALLVEADLWPGPVHDYQKDYNAGVKSLAKKIRKLKDAT